MTEGSWWTGSGCSRRGWSTGCVPPRPTSSCPGQRRKQASVETLRIVLMEATVHLLDLQRALELAPDVPAAALGSTVRLLAEVTPAVELIEAATGRSATSPLPVLR